MKSVSKKNGLLKIESKLRAAVQMNAVVPVTAVK